MSDDHDRRVAGGIAHDQAPYVLDNGEVNRNQRALDEFRRSGAGDCSDVRLKPGWLIEDVRKAVKRLDEWATPRVAMDPVVDSGTFPDGTDRRKAFESIAPERKEAVLVEVCELLIKHRHNSPAATAQIVIDAVLDT